MTTYTIKPVIWTCPVTFRKRKMFRLWIGNYKLAAWSWPNAREARKAAERLAAHWPNVPHTIVNA